MRIRVIKHSRTKKNGLAPLFMELREEKPPRRRKHFYIGIDVNPLFFDSSKGYVLEPFANSGELNMLIDKLKGRANEILIKYRLQGKYISVDDFTSEFRNNTDSEDFLAFFKKEIRHVSKTREYATAISYIVAYKKLDAFSGGNFRFGQLNYTFTQQFDLWMRARKLSHNTRAKNHKILRAVINSAIRREFVLKNPYTEFRMVETQSERVYLDKEELKKLHDLYIAGSLSDMQQEILRAFLFSCFTSLRISDIQNLQRKNFDYQKITFFPKKSQSRTNKKLEIPLSKHAVFLLNRSIEGKQFNIPSDQKVNKNLKKIGEKAEVFKHLTFHVARHTFATLFLEMGGRVEVLQNILGHYNIRDTMVYVHIVDKEKEKQIKLMNDIFSY